ncbi:hypothetical protein QYE76_051183 [Lolium multiflorum]|uniref:CCHC-type domain-containing protein n=1 Tax=Lolium multiflorum TaxID=4521 RepID=A0AAD8WHY6_LOLMU|nr:hypothetical protein QYE76_051183 [Lolium multiflorum]
MGKTRDTKIAILPSTTRKGTTLSTSAALDSPSVIDKLVSPPHASRAGTSAESENSHNIDNVSAVLDDSGSLGSFLDATIARSRQIENTETPNENAATPVNSPESVEYSSDDLDEDYVELDNDFIEKCKATTDARKIKKLLAEHAVRYKLSPDPKFATSPINIRDKDYDFSLDLSHIAIVEKTPFCGTEKESAVEHLTELSTLSGVFSDDVKMRTYFVAKIFPFSLKDDAKTWYNNLPPGSIKSPTDLRDVFFRKYFPASAQHAALQRIYNFDQEDGEKLPEAWARFCSLIRAQPDHDLEKHDLLDIFYSGLTIESRAYLDSCAGCVFRKRTPDDAEELLAKIGRNHDDWSTPEPTPTPIVKKRGMIKLNDEDMREAKKSLKEKGIKPEDVKNLPPIEDICETIPPSSMIEDPLYPEGHPKRVEQDSQLTKTSAPSKKKKKKHKNIVESSEPVNDPNSISISDAETESGNEHDKDNDKDDTPDKEEIEKEPEKPVKNKKYTKEDFIAEKHGAVIDCNKGMVTFNVDDKEHTVYFPKRIDKMAPPTRNNPRAQANQMHIEHAKMTDTINILAMERKALRHQHAKKDYLIARLRVRIASLEQLIPIPNHAPRGKSTVTCYECGVTGHYSNKCPMKAANNAPRTGSNAVPIAQKDKSTVTCYECGTVGHYSNECPKKLAKIALNTAAPAQQQQCRNWKEVCPKLPKQPQRSLLPLECH